MIYNQKQRQLIIWDQRGTREKFVSYFLLFNLGLRLMVRDAFRRLKYSESTVHEDAVYHNEPVVNS
ncbi:hypothetical protein [Saccharicrinis sp. FJH54]|uniref:hypothetical protein n=1 Tax=Saccharicrinis sp. FJH54 TaxID=3344665 RepID=UPI0035D42C60